MSEQPRFWRKPTKDDIDDTFAVLFFMCVSVGSSVCLGWALARWLS